jgi:signal transduction histidine kinase
MNDDTNMFDTLLASTVHDMKNSLSLLMNELEAMGSKLEENDENRQTVSSLRYETSRINISLMELLTLYKLEKKQISIQIEEVVVADILEDYVAVHSFVAKNRDVQLDFECDDSLIWFLDPGFLHIVINNIVGNSIRYTRSRVIISAFVIDQQLCIQIDDDGQGYPEQMISSVESFSKTIDVDTGSTGLGLYFASTIAKNHSRHGRTGDIVLKNNEKLTGGCFKILLP